MRLWPNSSASPGVGDALDLVRDEARRLRERAPATGRLVAAAGREIERLAAGVIQGAAANAGFEQRIAALSEQAEILADAARESPSRSDDRGGGPAVLGRRGARAHSRAIGATSSAAGRLACRRGYERWRTPRGRWRWRWTSTSCSTPTACCSRSAIRRPKGALDPSCYDLLASEARLASFMAIAKGDAPGAALVPPRPRGDAGRRAARR